VPDIAPLLINGPAMNDSSATTNASQRSTATSTYHSTTSINEQSASEAAQQSETSFAPFSAFDTRATDAKLTPLPLLSSTESETEEPRTHIVVDGDSLAKLAGRYLDDPRRADEILQLNRGVLSDPELLPIGVELLIPPRAQDASITGASPQSNLPRAVAIHSPRGSGLVPVRPIPAASTLTPRARLVNPRSAE
jgi:nucleoid-associated protein YgaU